MIAPVVKTWFKLGVPPPKRTRYLVYGKDVGWTFATYRGNGNWLYAQVVMTTKQMKEYFTHWGYVDTSSID